MNNSIIEINIDTHTSTYMVTSTDGEVKSIIVEGREVDGEVEQRSRREVEMSSRFPFGRRSTVIERSNGRDVKFIAIRLDRVLRLSILRTTLK